MTDGTEDILDMVDVWPVSKDSILDWVEGSVWVKGG